MLSDIEFLCPECDSRMQEYTAQGGEYDGEVLMACPKAVKLSAATIEPHSNPKYKGYSFFQMPAVMNEKREHGPVQFYRLSTLLPQAEAALGQPQGVA